jgi:IrrE N-terminal-like domain
MHSSPEKTNVLVRERYTFATGNTTYAFRMDVSLLEKARWERPGVPDEHLVIGISCHLVDELAVEPPVDPRLLASYQGIVRLETADIPVAGCLVAVGDHFVIRVRATDTRRRQRFTAFHEVGHTFMPGYRLVTQHRCNPSQAAASREPIELLCDVAASEMLLPRSHFGCDLDGASFGLAAVEDLCDRYDASLEATAHRFVSLWPEDVLLVVFEHGTKPRDRPDAPHRLRVVSARGKGRWPFIPPYKSLPDDHPISAVLAGDPMDGTGMLAGLSQQLSEPVDLSARLYPYYDHDGSYRMRVLTLARRRSPTHPG